MSLMVQLADVVWDPGRRQRRDLRRELATYRSGRESEDLLATVDRCSDVQAERVRDLLFRLSLPAGRGGMYAQGQLNAGGARGG